MNRKFLFAAVFLAGCSFYPLPFLSAGETISFPKQPVKGYYFCRALEDPTPEHVKGRSFYTGVFEVTDAALNPVIKGFVEFLRQKENYKLDDSYLNSSVTCYSANTQEATQSQKETYLNQAKKYPDSGWVDTGWIFKQS